MKKRNNFRQLADNSLGHLVSELQRIYVAKGDRRNRRNKFLS
jgi:hypothetical protein